MLRTVHAHASELLASDEPFAAAARLAHAEVFAEIAADLQQQASGVRRDVIGLIASELGNMRNAWDEWVARGDVGRLNGMLPPMWGFYDARGDYRSAVELGDALLRCLAATPDSAERRRDEFAVRMSVARTELVLKGYTAEAEQLIRDALERVEATADDQQRFPGLRCLGHMHVMRADFDSAGAVAEQVMAMADASHDPVLLAEAHILAGMSVSWQVDFPSSLGHYAKAVAYADATPKGRVDFRVGPHPAVVANGVSALTQWFVGLADTAAASMARALEMADDLDHPYSVAYALHHAGLLDLWRGDLDTLSSRTNALRELAEAHDYPMWRALSLILGGVAMVGHGNADEGMAQVDEGFTLYRGLATPPVFWPALLMIHANSLALAGRYAEAVVAIEEAEGVVQSGDPVVVDLLVVHGDLDLAASPANPAAAEARFEEAAVIAARRGARAGRLQALTRLARLRHGTPGEDDARAALRELYDELTEGRDLPHMVAARAVLDGIFER